MVGKRPEILCWELLLIRGGVLTKSILLSLLLLGTSYGANAATINDGDTLIGSANINVTKDDTAQTITITTNGLATTAELNIY